jgi:excisionase family DNA binding protein
MNKDVRASDLACSSEQELLTPREAAAYLRVSKSYLDKLRVYGGGPRFLRLGKRKVLYRKFDLDAWLASQSFDSTSEYEAFAPSAAEKPYNKSQRSTTTELQRGKN